MTLPAILDRRWHRLGTLLCTVTLVVAPNFTRAAENLQLPDIGDSSSGLLSPAEEERLGQAFMRSLRGKLKLVEEPEMVDYIQALGSRLTAANDARGREFRFFLVDDPSINAFAGPAGHIGINTGLILATQSESELAAVMAHEIAHVTQHHLLRTFEAASHMSLPTAALLLAGIVLGAASGSNDIAQAAVVGVQAGAAQMQINFTRANEQEADRIGIQILSETGFDPHSMPGFFERMERATRLYASDTPEFLRTHPVSTSRIADSKTRAESYPYRQYPDDLRYHLLRAQLRVRAITDPDEAVRSFRQSLAEERYRNQAAERFGLALALTRAKDYGAARNTLGPLIKADPGRSEYVIALAAIEQRAGNLATATRILHQALEIAPNNHPLTLHYAQTLLDDGKAGQAATILERQLADHPDDAGLYKLLSQAAGAAGHESEGHQYLAEYHYLNGRLEQAVEHLKLALKIKGIDFYQRETLDARLKQVKEELDALDKDEKEAARDTQRRPARNLPSR